MASKINKLKSAFLVTCGGSLGFGAISIIKGDERFYGQYLMPLVHNLFDGEQAHKLAIGMAKYGLVPQFTSESFPSLKCKVWDREFNNPIGLAAGFDKDGEGLKGLIKMGFGFVEVGSITPLPQSGNPKPRVFRLKEDEAVINRYGCNSQGHSAAFQNITKYSLSSPCLIGINIGKNKTSDSPIEDYSQGLLKFNEISDYMVINISSPNTPGLRDLQNKEHFRQLLDAIVSVHKTLKNPKPLLVKIAPDLSPQERRDIASLALEKGIDGLIVSNTTLQRPHSLKSNNQTETGGLSGRPLADLSTELIKDMYVFTEGKVPIIGVGGVFTGEDAYKKIRAGASLIQIYSVLVYQGPPAVQKIKRELEELLKKDNFSNISEAIGKDNIVFKTT